MMRDVRQGKHDAKTEEVSGLEITAIETCQTRIDARGRSPFASPVPKCDVIDGAETLRHRMHSKPMIPAGAAADARLTGWPVFAESHRVW